MRAELPRTATTDRCSRGTSSEKSIGTGHKGLMPGANRVGRPAISCRHSVRFARKDGLASRVDYVVATSSAYDNHCCMIAMSMNLAKFCPYGSVRKRFTTRRSHNVSHFIPKHAEQPARSEPLLITGIHSTAARAQTLVT